MDYRNADTGNLHRDALRRTREMHIQNNTHNVQAEFSKKKQTVESGFLSGLFDDGKPDNDRIIIIALIIILAKEGADLKLLIALGYILM